MTAVVHERSPTKASLVDEKDAFAGEGHRGVVERESIHADPEALVRSTNGFGAAFLYPVPSRSHKIRHWRVFTLGPPHVVGQRSDTQHSVALLENISALSSACALLDLRFRSSAAELTWCLVRPHADRVPLRYE